MFSFHGSGPAISPCRLDTFHTHQAYFYTIHNIIPGLESINFVFLVAHDKLWT